MPTDDRDKQYYREHFKRRRDLGYRLSQDVKLLVILMTVGAVAWAISELIRR